MSEYRSLRRGSGCLLWWGWILVALSCGVRDGAASDDAERLGPSSRRTGLAITEILHHPAPSPRGRELEFVELFNSDLIPAELGGFRIRGSIEFTFPNGTTLEPGCYLVVAKSPADLTAGFGITNVTGPFRGSLRSSTGRVVLEDEFGAVLLEARIETTPPWPVAAAGGGHSMVLARPSFGEGDPRAWESSRRMGGSPGGPEPTGDDRLQGLMFNEILIATTSREDGYVELYNHSNEPLDLSGSCLAHDAAAPGFRIPMGTVLGPRGFVRFTWAETRIVPDVRGGRLFLLNPKRNRVVDAIEYPPQEPGVAFGRFPDGVAEFSRLSTPTPGLANAVPKPSPVVIHEIMYHPISGSDRDQYVELLNRTDQAVPIGNWSFVHGIRFTFPADTVLPPHGLVVVARDARRLRATSSELNRGNCFGNFGGTLSRSGERIALARPVPIGSGREGAGREQTVDVVMNEVTYQDGGQWGNGADGGGSSLELIDPDADTRRADNWRDSDETSKSAWTTVEFTGGVGMSLGSRVGESLHLYLLGEGECLVDDVEVRINGGSNVIANPGFESGMTGWIPQGAMDLSGVDAGGSSGLRSLHLRAGSRGDPGANRIRSAPFRAIAAGESVTIRCKARWLKGWPELLLRLQGGGAEASGRLLLPPNPGTPGRPNSRLAMPAGPALFEVHHQPVLPAAGQPVVVTARADSVRGLKRLVLRYRVDPAMTFSEIEMDDAGAAGDSIAGDGIFSATLPGQPAGTLIAFHLVATDSAGTANTFPREPFPVGAAPRLFPGDSLSHECLVRFGEVRIAGVIPSYRLWLTRANRDRWIARDRLSNADLDGTFVYDDQRVVYGAGAQTAGSPWHTDQMATGPDGTNRFDYVIHLPRDQPVLGETDLNLVIPGNGDGGNSSDLSALSEPVSLLLFRDLGLHSLHRRFIHFFVNGSERSAVSGLPGHFVYEDVQQPNGRALRGWFPGVGRGQLFKVEDWFEFTNSVATAFENKDADLVRRVVPGTTNLSTAPYRFMWRLRGLQAGESASDYGSLFRLIDAVSPTLDPTAPVEFDAVNRVADLEQWFRVIACQRAVGNWDSYGWDRGKNCYLYRPPNGRFILIPWDVDATLALGGNEPHSDLFESSDPRIASMLRNPAILRVYLRALQEVLDGPLRPGRLEAAFDVRASALVANGISLDSSLTVENKVYLAERRSFLDQQLRRTRVAFSVVAPTEVRPGDETVTLHGTAPPRAAEIWINSKPVTVRWRTPVEWSTVVPVHPGTNVFEVVGLDRTGGRIVGQTVRVVVGVDGKP